MAKQNVIESLSPLWVGIGISVSLIVILLLSATALGRWDALLAEGEFDALARVSSGVLRDIRLAIVFCLVLGYVSGAFLHVMQHGRRTVQLFREALDCTREEREALTAPIRLGALWLSIAGLIALALAFVLPYFIPPVRPAPWSPASWSLEVAWHRVLSPVILVLQAWLIYAVVSVSMRMSRIAKRLRNIDLLDLTPLAPFTHLGLTNAFLSIGLLSIWSLMMLETGFDEVMIGIAGVTLALTTLALLAPVGGVHKRICHSKDAELSWVNGEISKKLGSFRQSETDGQVGEMADLITYRSLVERVPEWPFTSSTYTRLFLYLLIPLVFWGVGIVAEEIVQGALSQ